MTTSTWERECEINERQLLQCVVEVARAALRAEASSVFVLDDATGELVFEAVAGRGEDHLIGTRLSRDTGIAGWAIASGQPFLADDLTGTPFSRSAAEQTGYIPRSIAAAPLFRDDNCVGVLEVLDRTADGDELETLDLLGLLASQAAAGLELLQRVRYYRRRELPHSSGNVSSTAMMDRIAAGLPSLSPEEEALLNTMLTFAGSLTEQAMARLGKS